MLVLDYGLILYKRGKSQTTLVAFPPHNLYHADAVWPREIKMLMLVLGKNINPVKNRVAIWVILEKSHGHLFYSTHGDRSSGTIRALVTMTDHWGCEKKTVYLPAYNCLHAHSDIPHNFFTVFFFFTRSNESFTVFLWVVREKRRKNDDDNNNNNNNIKPQNRWNL